MKALAIVAVSLAMVVAMPIRAGATPDRAGYVARAVAALRAMPPVQRAALDRELYEQARATCHADVQAPAATCLIELAKRRCGSDAACAAAADVIVANQLSVADFVDEAARVRIVRSSSDFHSALAAKLLERYGVLAAELALVAPIGTEDATGTTIGAAIDRVCRERDERVHACEPGAAACVPSLPWSRCVAAIAWYVAGGAR